MITFSHHSDHFRLAHALGSGSIDELIEKAKEMQVMTAAQNAALNTLSRILTSYNAQLLQWLGGGSLFIGRVTSTGIEIDGEDGFSLFIDLASKHALMDGAHIDFQWAEETIARILQSGMDFEDQQFFEIRMWG